MERYKELEQKLTALQKNLDEQIQFMDNMTDANFHKNLINLMGNHPEAKELIQFVVDVNDKLETRNEIFKDLIYNSLREILQIKQQAVMELIRELKTFKENQKPAEPLMETLKGYINNKTLLIAGAFVVGIVGLFFIPDQVIGLAKIIFGAK